MKPLFRFTVGPLSQYGFEVTIESVFRAINALGADEWDWVICYNGITKTQLKKMSSILSSLPVKFYPQNWAECPIDDYATSPVMAGGVFQINGSICGGSLWKICPPRLRINSHEIIMDNDIILLKKPPVFDEWLKDEGHTLILEEAIRFYGRYSHLLPNTPPYLNSGIMGLPPGYDFESQIRKAWEAHGELKGLTQADEQGLLMYVLSQEPSYRLNKNDIIMLLKTYEFKPTEREYGYHFGQVNKAEKHTAWEMYKTTVGLWNK